MPEPQSRRNLLSPPLAFTALLAGLVLLALAGASACGPEREALAPPSVSHPDEGFVARALEASEKIMDATRGDERVHLLLSELCDEIGARPSPSDAYDRAAAWAKEVLRLSGASNARLQPVAVPHWVRGVERAEILEPNGPRPLALTTLGRGVGTGGQPLEGELLVVRDFEELAERAAEAEGRFVLFNYPMRDEPMFGAYGDAVRYRLNGAIEASKVGAIGALVRSVTTRSLATLHTGAMRAWREGERPIPAAAITIEDAMMFARLAERGIVPRIRVELGARTLGERDSPNVIAELEGRSKPDEIVLIGAHLDSWDMGTGAHDDGVGVVHVLRTISLLRELDLVPARTIRVVLFSNEERGLEGALTYLDSVRGELDTHVAALESDAGGFSPEAFSFDGSEEAFRTLEGLMPLFRRLGTIELRQGGSGADIGPLVRAGQVPGFGLRTDSTHYFDHHHAPSDTVDKVDPEELEDSLAAFALMTWLVAEMPETLPRKAPDEGR